MNNYRFVRLAIYSVLLAAMFSFLLWIGLYSPIVSAASTNVPNKTATRNLHQTTLAEETHIYLPIIQNNRPLIGHVDIALSLLSGTQMTSTIINGEQVTYTIIVTNNSSLDVQPVQLEDIVPGTAFSQITCLSQCYLVTSTQTFTDIFTDPSFVTITNKITWSLPVLTPNMVISRQFTAKIVGQNNGAALNNRAVLIFNYSNHQPGLIVSDLLATVKVLVNLPNLIGLNPDPSWISNEPAAATGLDWGDFDLDGDLDLALATSFQVSVYRNANGRLESYWTNQQRAIGVKWIQFDENEPLALIVVGDTDSPIQGKGQNYIYTWNKKVVAGSDIFSGRSFISNVPLARVEAGDFNNTLGVDLVMSALDPNEPCQTLIFTDIPKSGPLSPNYACVSTSRALALGVGNIDNQANVDLVIGTFPNDSKVLLSSTDPNFVITDSAPSQNIWVPPNPGFAPYDLALSDYNKDKRLDIAIAYPYDRGIRVYSNNGNGFDLQPPVLKLRGFPTSFALDWADYNYDGRLDLAAVGTKPSIFYQTSFITQPFLITPSMEIPVDGNLGRVWGVRAVDINNDGSLELSVASRDHPALIFPNYSLPLDENARPMAVDKGLPATTVVWADVNSDGYQDLILGGGSPASSSSEAFDAKIFLNSTQSFLTNDKPFLNTGTGPHFIAPADIDKDGKVEISLTTANQIRIYDSSDLITPRWSTDFAGASALAWGDMNGDGWLDLAATSNMGLFIFLNNNGVLSTTTIPISLLPSITDIAWGNVNNDYFLDLVASSTSEPIQVYLNRFGHHFDTYSLPASSTAARSFALADYNGDSWLDIVLASNTSKIVLYPNQAQRLFPANLPTTELPGTQSSVVTSMVWADADNDKDLDLAIAYESGAIQAFTNLNGYLVLAWKSKEKYSRAQVAWGDADHDGDMDLAFSQDDGQQSSGYFENRYIMPQNLFTDQPTRSIWNQPSAVWIAPPDGTGGSNSYAASRILSGPVFNTVTQQFVGKTVAITFQFTSSTYTNAVFAIQNAQYEYSLDGGGQWQHATSTITPSIVFTDVSTYTGMFTWNAFADKAISDDARFRIQIAHPHLNQGRVERASTGADNTPFRVRAVSCLWPTNPQIYLLSPEKLNENPPKLDLFGIFDQSAGGGGKLKFEWQIQGVTLTTYSLAPVGQRVTLPITLTNASKDPASIQLSLGLTVTGEACPIARPVIDSGAITITLPGKAESLIASSANTGETLRNMSELSGSVNSQLGTTTLIWSEDSQNAQITGYRVYAAPAQSIDFQVVATLPKEVTIYQDSTAICGRVYYVTAFNDVGESGASAESYYSGECAPE